MLEPSNRWLPLRLRGRPPGEVKQWNRIFAAYRRPPSNQSAIPKFLIRWLNDICGLVGRANYLDVGPPAKAASPQFSSLPAHTYQSDVETVHRLVEDEFFDLEAFSSRGDFLAKAHTYQLYFNLVQPNSHKQNLSPWQIIERLAPRLPRTLLASARVLGLLPQPQGGYDLPIHPFRA